MEKKYQDVYPEDPLLSSDDLKDLSALSILKLEFFEAEPGEMPYEVFSQHHILINLKDEPHRVENWRNGEHRDFTYRKNEIVVTPAGVKSGWKWHAKSKVIVVTLEPEKLERFALNELNIFLTEKQLENQPQFVDEDITSAGIMLLDALTSDNIGSESIYECYARIFLIKLIQKYGEVKEEIEFNKSFTSENYKRVFNYVEENFSKTISIDDLASEVFLSPYHFSRLFKETVGKTPHQFVMTYRIEQAKKMLKEKESQLVDVAHSCGFSDQSHFSRVFKQIEGVTPSKYVKNL